MGKAGSGQGLARVTRQGRRVKGIVRVMLRVRAWASGRLRSRLRVRFARFKGDGLRVGSRLGRTRSGAWPGFGDMAWVTGRLKARQDKVRGLVRVRRYGMGYG